jgi:hypothetical protein
MEINVTTDTEAMRVLQECVEVMRKKSNDYQNPHSNIKQADYYPNGVLTILDLIHAKSLRLRSVLDAMRLDPNYKPNFESIEDSAKDLINYSAFIVAYSRGQMQGQHTDRDIFNRPKVSTSTQPQVIDTINISDWNTSVSYDLIDNSFDEQYNIMTGRVYA